MKSGVITGLNNNSQNGQKIKQDGQSLYACSRCALILTMKQSERISCAMGQSSFVDARGTIYYEHMFDEPLDTDLYIKYFREKHRLCWKEIYLKFGALMQFEAMKCLKCDKWFTGSQIG
jgi:hypothetical protein